MLSKIRKNPSPGEQHCQSFSQKHYYQENGAYFRSSLQEMHMSKKLLLNCGRSPRRKEQSKFSTTDCLNRSLGEPHEAIEPLEQALEVLAQGLWLGAFADLYRAGESGFTTGGSYNGLRNRTDKNRQFGANSHCGSVARIFAPRGQNSSQNIFHHLTIVTAILDCRTIGVEVYA